MRIFKAGNSSYTLTPQGAAFVFPSNSGVKAEL